MVLLVLHLFAFPLLPFSVFSFQCVCVAEGVAGLSNKATRVSSNNNSCYKNLVKTALLCQIKPYLH